MSTSPLPPPSIPPTPPTAQERIWLVKFVPSPLPTSGSSTPDRDPEPHWAQQTILREHCRFESGWVIFFNLDPGRELPSPSTQPHRTHVIAYPAHRIAGVEDITSTATPNANCPAPTIGSRRRSSAPTPDPYSAHSPGTHLDMNPYPTKETDTP